MSASLGKQILKYNDMIPARGTLYCIWRRLWARLSYKGLDGVFERFTCPKVDGTIRLRQTLT
jgi:hypothetical protein